MNRKNRTHQKQDKIDTKAEVIDKNEAVPISQDSETTKSPHTTVRSYPKRSTRVNPQVVHYPHSALNDESSSNDSSDDNIPLKTVKKKPKPFATEGATQSIRAGSNMLRNSEGHIVTDKTKNGAKSITALSDVKVKILEKAITVEKVEVVKGSRSVARVTRGSSQVKQPSQSLQLDGSSSGDSDGDICIRNATRKKKHNPLDSDEDVGSKPTTRPPKVITKKKPLQGRARIAALRQEAKNNIAIPSVDFEYSLEKLHALTPSQICRDAVGKFFITILLPNNITGRIAQKVRHVVISGISSVACAVVNGIKGIDGETLVLSVNAVLKDPRLPVYCFVYDLKLHKYGGTHNSKDVDDAVSAFLPRVILDFPNAFLYLVRDCNSVNYNFKTKRLHSYEGFNDVYCLPHMLCNQAKSITQASAKSDHKFQTAEGADIKVHLAFGNFTRFTLLTADLNVMHVKIVLSAMSYDDAEGSVLRSILVPKPNDTADVRITKGAQTIIATVYKHQMQSNVGEAKSAIRQLLGLFDNFVMTTGSNRNRRTCWGEVARLSLKLLLQAEDNIPMMCFTTCCDELVSSSSQSLVDHKFRQGRAAQRITNTSLAETVEILCRKKPNYVHNLFGSYTYRRVKFINNLK